jgi:peptide/nickel transport system permease protein
MKKAAYSISIVLGVCILVFFLFRISGSDPVRNVLGENTSSEMIENTRVRWNLDLSTTEQLGLFLNDLSPISFHSYSSSSRWKYRAEDYTGVILPLGATSVALKVPFLGRSYISDKSVNALLVDTLPGTLLLAVVSIVMAMIIGIVLGVYSARHEGSKRDKWILTLSSLGMSAPSFFVAVLISWLLSIKWGAYTHLPMNGSLFKVDPWQGKVIAWENMVLPILTLMIRPLGVIVQLTRNAILETMGMDFIRTARAKGLSESTIMWRHALPNSLNPVLTAISGWFASLLAGAVFVEFVFGWKGLGQLMFQAIEKQDLPVVMGGVIVISVFFVAISSGMDRLYAKLDPRVRL